MAKCWYRCHLFDSIRDFDALARQQLLLQYEAGGILLQDFGVANSTANQRTSGRRARAGDECGADARYVHESRTEFTGSPAAGNGETVEGEDDTFSDAEKSGRHVAERGGSGSGQQIGTYASRATISYVE